MRQQFIEAEAPDAFPTLESGTFAEACYNMNSIIGLVNALRRKPDETDCKIWNLSAQEWRDSVADALIARIEDIRQK